MRAAWSLFGIGVCGACLATALAPWKLEGAGRLAELAAQMSHDTGLQVQVGGPMTLKLFPRPRLRVAEVAVSSPDRAIGLSAPALFGDLDITEFLRGHWRLVTATLSDPTATVDLDKPRGSLSAGLPWQASPTPLKLSVRSGVVRLHSRRMGLDTTLTDVAATAEQEGGAGGSLAASGSAIWRGVPGQFTMRLGAKAVLSGGQSSGFVQISSPVGSFSAVGKVTGGVQPQFAGRLSASTNAPDRLLGALGMRTAWIDLQRLSLAGDASAKWGDLSLSDSVLRLNGTTFEGTLGYHSDGERGLIEGTLATDMLDLNGLTRREFRDETLAALYGLPLGSEIRSSNLDLRLSASNARLGTTEAQDAAGSVLLRDNRLELTLDEAHAFGGTVKARALGSFGAKDVAAHAEVALSDVELGPLGSAVVGRERVTGKLNGRVALDGQGATLRDIVGSLNGEGQVAIGEGSFVGVSISQALRRLTRKLPLGADQAHQVTVFKTASADMRIDKGVLNLLDGKVTGPGIQMSFGGHTDLPKGRMDILAEASQTDAAGSAIPDGPHLPIEMRGTWGSSLTLVQQAHGLTLPPLPFPGLDPSQALP